MTLFPTVILTHFLSSACRPPEEKKELGRFKIPNWLAFLVLLCVGISAGVVFA
jgi:hypothetical protein